MRLLKLVGLEEYIDELPTTLPLGHQKRMEISHALALRPRVLMLDEPFAGLSQEDIAPLLQVIKNLRSGGITILLVEQNAKKTLAVAKRGYVLETGRIVLHDTASNLEKNPLIKKAYLGG